MSRIALKAIAAAQIAGAIAAGLLECTALFLTIRSFDSRVSIPYVLVDAGFCFGVVALTLIAGARLWQSLPSGLKLSAWAQALQIPLFVSASFTYKVKLGIGLWIFWQNLTWYLGFNAAVGDVETALSFADSDTPTAGINILAVVLLVYLLRVMARNRRAASGLSYKSMPAIRRSAPARVLRFVVKSLIIVLAVVLTPVLIWWIFNRIDEAPTPEAQHWFAPLQRQTADAKNAWLYMLGLGAAEDSDPIAFGRKRLDAYEARQRERTQLPVSAQEQALKDDPVPFKSVDTDATKLVYLCTLDQADCLQEARYRAPDLAKLERINAVRLRRYAAMLELPEFEEASTPSEDDPVPNTGDDNSLYRALILRDLSDPQRRSDALARLQQLTQFWQRVGEHAQSMVMKQIASRLVVSSERVLDTFVDEYGMQALDASGDVVASVLRAPGAGQSDLELPLRRDAIAFQQTMSKTLFGPIDTLRYCQPTPKASCLSVWLMSQAYVPQATLNLRARLFDGELDLYRADATDNEAARKRWADVMERYMFIGKARESLRALAYNIVGKTLAYISVEGAVWADELHDREAFRRMLSVKFAALAQHIAPQAMPDFLAAQAENMRNPYGGPFGWDAAFNEIYFEPRSARSKLLYQALAYRDYPKEHAYRIAACAHPLHVELKVTEAISKQTVTRNISGCGSGLASGTDETPEDQRDQLFDGMLFEDAHVGVGGGHIGLRVRIKDGDVQRDYAARDVVADGSEVKLQRTGHKGGPELSATIQPAKPARYVTVDVDSTTPLQQFARDVAHAAQIDVRHIERLGNARRKTTIRFDRISAEDQLRLLIDLSDAKVVLRDLGNGNYEFAPAP